VQDKRKEGQNKEKCNISGCDNTGRKFGSLGSIDIFYCPEHRKIGERIMNHLWDDKRNYYRTELLYHCKHSLMFESNPKLCDECNKKIVDFLGSAIEMIDFGKEFMEENEIKE